MVSRSSKPANETAVGSIVVGTAAPSIFAGSQAFCSKKKKRSSGQVRQKTKSARGRDRDGGSESRAENRPLRVAVNRSRERTATFSVDMTYE